MSAHPYPRFMNEFEVQEFDILVFQHGYETACNIQEDIDERGLLRSPALHSDTDWDY